MHRDIAERWVKAMRSGNYTKGKGYLKRRLGTTILHCPFGILLDIAIHEGPFKAMTPVKVSLGFAEDYWEYCGTYAALPKVVAEWAGCPDGYLLNGVRITVPDAIIDELNSNTSTSFFRHGEKVSVATINDLTTVSLSQMADYVELEFCQ